MIIHVCCTVYNLVLIYKLIQLSLSKDSQFFCWYYLLHQRLSFSLHKGFGRNSMIVNHRKYKSKIIFETLIEMYKTINKIMTYIIYLRIINFPFQTTFLFYGFYGIIKPTSPKLYFYFYFYYLFCIIYLFCYLFYCWMFLETFSATYYVMLLT